MARLFIFAIGGTGSRVLKSLTMLLAAGVKPDAEREYEIVPIIIDPHKSNEDLKRTETLIENYQSILNDVDLGNGFFNTKISTLKNIVSAKNKLTNSFTFNLQEVAGQKFKQYIGYEQLDLDRPENEGKPNKSLATLLFSGTSINKRNEKVPLLDIEMDIGFIGNPNIGSVVLNQFKDSEEFKEFASNYNADDRVFIISSIFGGTGAAGFPTILKNIRDAKTNSSIDSKGFLQNAKIGAISVLPYFNIKKDDKSPIQKSDFIAKSKAALYYYKDNVAGNRLVNALYYIADDFSGKPYENDPGDKGQMNHAHFVELASALAILNFMEIQDRDLQCDEGRAVKPIFKSFFTRNDKAHIKFGDLDKETYKNIGLHLSQLTLFKKYLDERFSETVGVQPWSVDAPEIKKSTISNAYSDFFDAYKLWLVEMSTNLRGFSPFNLDSSIENLICDVTGEYKKMKVFKAKMDYHYIDDALSNESKNKSYKNSQQKLIKLFYETTKEVLNNCYGFKK